MSAIKIKLECAKCGKPISLRVPLVFSGAYGVYPCICQSKTEKSKIKLGYRNDTEESFADMDIPTMYEMDEDGY